MKGMWRKLVFFLLALIFIFSSIPVNAEEKPVIYKETITVTEDGGRYQIGFVNVEFKKDFLNAEKLPITFEVTVYCENGIPGISFTPDVPDFYKKVHIRTDSYTGLLYDATTGKNIQVNVDKQQVLAPHFSFWSLD